MSETVHKAKLASEQQAKNEWEEKVVYDCGVANRYFSFVQVDDTLINHTPSLADLRAHVDRWIVVYGETAGVCIRFSEEEGSACIEAPRTKKDYDAHVAACKEARLAMKKADFERLKKELGEV